MRLGNKLKAKIAAVCLLILGTTAAANDLNYVPAFRLNPINDGIQLGLGASLTGSALIADKLVHLKKNEFNPTDWKKSDIPDFDQIFMRPYSKPLHIAGTVSVGLTIAAPVFLAFMPGADLLTLGTMYAETMLLANGIKEWLKLLVYRARPYMYFDGYPMDKVSDGDWNCSFPSGHTTLAFAGAAFTTMVFCQCYPDSNLKYVVAGISFGLAALTGALRMASGNHFFSDVLVGALIGTTCGFLVPYLHSNHFYSHFEKQPGNARAAIAPNGISFNIAL